MPPNTLTKLCAGGTKIMSPDLNLVLNLDLPNIKVSYRSIVSITLLPLTSCTSLNDPSSEGPPAAVSA